MPIEYERKFLVTSKDLQEVRGRVDTLCEVEDRYLDPISGSIPLRLRTINVHGAPKTRQLVLAVKVGTPPHADEMEYIWPAVPPFLASGPLAVKRRFEWVEDHLRFHIDDYSYPPPPQGELIAEVEFLSDEVMVSFVPPTHWVEVTGRKEYSNYSIAKYGWPAREP